MDEQAIEAYVKAAAAALEHQANLAKQGIQGSTTDSKWLADVLKKVHTPASH